MRPTRTNSTYKKKLPEKKIGPMIGMSDSTGITIGSNRGGMFRSLCCDRTRVDRNAVIPAAKMLITVPAMIWLTRYRIARTARTAASSPPVMTAPIRPAQVLPVTLATTAATKAPDRSMPSIAMFTTPARSQSTPDRAANVIGTAR